MFAKVSINITVMNKLNILVIGGSGYIGSVLVEKLLKQQHDITVIDNLYFNQSSLFHLCHYNNFKFILGDIRDKTLIKTEVNKNDVIIPLAALVGAPACAKDPSLANEVNYESIRYINSIKSDGQLIIMPVTNSGYGSKDNNIYCDENTPLEPISEYGVSKMQAEEVILSKNNAVSLRLATVFGMSSRMRFDLLVNHFVYTAINDSYIVIFEKDFKRNFVHVRDVADAFIHVINNSKKMSGNAYNLGLNNANISKKELAILIKNKIPNFYIHYSDIDNDPDKRNYIVSNEKIKNTGFEAKIQLSDGIDELITGIKMIGRNKYKNV